MSGWSSLPWPLQWPLQWPSHWQCADTTRVRLCRTYSKTESVFLLKVKASSTSKKTDTLSFSVQDGEGATIADSVCY